MKIWITACGCVSNLIQVHRVKPEAKNWYGKGCGYITSDDQIYCRDVFKDLEPLPRKGTKKIVEVDLKVVR